MFFLRISGILYTKNPIFATKREKPLNISRENDMINERMNKLFVEGIFMKEKKLLKALGKMPKAPTKAPRKKLSDIRFNNGEPIAVAVRKSAVQLLIILAVLALIYVFFIGRALVTDYLTDDSVFSLTMNSRYKEALLLEGNWNYTAEESSGLAAAAAVARMMGESKTESDFAENYKHDPTKFISGMTDFLEASFPEHYITAEANISNYTMMTEIYEHLKKGSGIIVSMGGSEDEYAIVDDEIIYAVVIGVNFTDDTVTVLTPYGRTETMFTEDFLIKTRFENADSLSFLQKNSFLLGYRAKNCIYFIEEQ